MPFKSRKRKISASEKRFAFSSDGLISYGAIDEKINIDRPINRQSKPEHIESSYDYVRKDMLKIFMLAVTIIAFQIILGLTR